MKPFRNIPLQWKLTVIVTLTTLVAMFLASVGIIYYEGVSARNFLVKELKSTADIIGKNSAVAMRFQVRKDALQLLESLAPKEHVIRACLLTPEGKLFAEFATTDLPKPESPILTDGHVFTDRHLMLSRRIIHDGDLLGSVHLTANLKFLHEQRRQAISTTALVLVSSTLLSLFLAMYWLSAVSRPITNLVKTAGRISASGDYSMRARQFEDDDLGRLTAEFNDMLNQIQKRDAELSEAHEELKRRHDELAEEKEELTRSRERENELVEKLSRSERLESLGLLAGGVAHDLNNILGPMVAYPELIMDSLPEDDKRLRHMMSQINNSARKASGVIRNLLTMGRRGSYELEVAQLNDVIRSFCDSPEFAETQRNYANVDHKLELADDLWPIQASLPHLSQVVMNLVINAFEAIGRNNGQVLIRTERTAVNDPIDGYETIEKGLYVKLSVVDSGCGIVPEKLNRIFEPFFTGKKLGRSGSGLGLAVVYGIVHDFDGQIDLASEPGKGTRFDLYFPPMLEVPAKSDIPEADHSGTERILVVDDVREQREMAAELLETMGYETETAANGHLAVDYLKENDVDLVILDMIMEEGFDGLDTYREILEFNPTQKCIIASGFSESERVREAQLLGAGAYVSKPYTRNIIGKAVRDELDREV